MSTSASAARFAPIVAFNSLTFEPAMKAHTDSLKRTRDEFFEEEIPRMQVEVEQGRRDQQELLAMQAQHQSELQQEEQRTLQMASECNELDTQARITLPSKINDYRTSLQHKDAQNQSLSSQVASIQSITRRELDAVTRGVRMFTERLGVYFKPDDGKLYISFNYILPESTVTSEPQHSVAIRVDEKDRAYHLVECQPEIPDMYTLIDQLNKDGNFSKFIVRVRKQFVEYEKERQ